MFANAVDVVEGRQQGGQHVDDAVLTEAFLLLLRAVAEVDELRAFALQRLQIFGGFLLGLTKGGQRIVGFAVGSACLVSTVSGSGIAIFLRLRGSRLSCTFLRCASGGSGGIGGSAVSSGSGGRGGLPGQVIHVGQVVQVLVLVEIGHDYLLSLSSSSTTSASTTSSSEPLEAEPAAPAPAAPAAPAASAAPCCA